MKKRTSKKVLSTYEKHVSSMSPERRKEFERGYQEELLSELLHAMMKEDHLTVRELAKAAGVSPTIIQELKTGKKTNITLLTAAKIASSLRHRIAFLREEEAKR